MYRSPVENLLQINRKLFLKLLWSLVSVRQRFAARLPCRSVREGSVAPLLLSLTLEPEETPPAPAGWTPPRTFLTAIASVKQRAHFYQPHVLKFCPSVSHRGLSATWGYGGCCSFPSAFFFSSVFVMHDYIWLCVCSVCTYAFSVCGFFYMTRI